VLGTGRKQARELAGKREAEQGGEEHYRDDLCFLFVYTY